MNRAACTIISPNYLAYARTLAASYLAQHPAHRFFVLIVADLADVAGFNESTVFEAVSLFDIGLENPRVEAMKYDILELNTNVKPTFLKFLLERYGVDQLVYLDPDIFVYAPLSPVFDALDGGASAVLTPHVTTPVFDGKSPSEQDILYNGTYNLGFIAVQRTHSAAVLDWWERRCLDLGFSEGRTGLFVDQKWMNLAPGLFPNVHISRDAGLNMAYWNLHERKLSSATISETFEGASIMAAGYKVTNAKGEAVPLRFFHFSGVVVNDPTMLSKHTDRFTLASRPDVTQLFADYKSTVQAEKMPALESVPYGFDHFSDGTTVTRLARRLFAVHQQHFSDADPFQAESSFAQFAKHRRLVKGHLAPAKSTWKEFNPRDRRVGAVHTLLRITLQLLGPHRYELLMRYLAHISVLRNQSVFLRDSKWPKP